MSNKQNFKKRPQAYQNRPMGNNTSTGEKAKNFKGTIIKLMKYLAAFRWQLLTVIVFTISSTIFAIISPKILGEATNQIVKDYRDIKTYELITKNLPDNTVLPNNTTVNDILNNLPNRSEIESKIPADQLQTVLAFNVTKKPTFHFDIIGQIILWLIGLYLVSAVLRYLGSWIMTNITQKITFKMRQDISSKINRLPFNYFDKQTYGEILSRITNDVDTVSQTFNQSLSQIVSALVMIIGIMIMMLSISWQMTIVALLTLPISMSFVLVVIKKSQTQFMNQQIELGKLNGHIEEMYAGHQVMQAFNGQARSIKKFKTINNKLYKSAWKSQFLSGVMWPIMDFVGNLGYVGIAVLGGWLAINGRLQVGDIQAFIQYMRQFNQPIEQTANIANILQSTATAAERVFEFLDEPEEAKENKNLVKIKKVKGEIEFKNVTFGYNPDKIIINNLSVHIRPGQRVAIVGPTGAGKTTLVNLLMRFYEINSGTIKIDGIDVRKMKRSDVRQMFGMVLQDTWLFSGTIRDNLRYGKPDATEDEIIAVAKEAHVDHFVRSLPGGYGMVLDEEATNISQGEKQLLTIARAMLAKTPMLILDEATSSVDTRTELLIQQAMDRLMKGKTSFVIAHRLSTIRNADLILVVKEGNIIEQGTHQELLKQHGFYAELYNSQFAD